MQQIADWLEKLGMSEYAQRFAENGIDLSVLPDLTDQDFKEMGVLLGHRRKLLRAIAELNDTPAAAASAPAPLPPPPIAAAAGAPSAQAVGERRYLTVMFCDLVGSTGIAAQLDAEEWRDLVGAYLDAASAAVTEMGGHVAKKLGDGLMALFGYPAAQENDAERAARAALAIQRALAELNRKNAVTGKPELAARIGLETGPAVVDAAGEIYGDVANVAARVQALAEPGAVLVTARVQRQVAGLFVAEERGTHTLKGVPEPTALFRLVRASGGGRRSAQRNLTPLVGRDDEIDDADAALGARAPGRRPAGDDCGRARTRKIAPDRRISCPALATRRTPGSNGAARSFCKTRRCIRSPNGAASASAAMTYPPSGASPSWRVRSSQVKLDPAENVPLLAPLLDIPLPQDRTPTLAPEELRRRQLAALTNWAMASAKVQPVVLAFEDLHWADPTTLDVLRGIAERGALAPLLIVATTRPEFRPPWSMRSHHGTISLAPLDRAQVRDMVAELSARHALPKEVVDDVAARTGGVPLFVEEVTRLLLERGEQGGIQAIPPTLQQSLDGAARPARPGARGGADWLGDRTRLLLWPTARRGRDGGRSPASRAGPARRSRHRAGPGRAARKRLSFQARAHPGRRLRKSAQEPAPGLAPPRRRDFARPLCRHGRGRAGSARLSLHASGPDRRRDRMVGQGRRPGAAPLRLSGGDLPSRQGHRDGRQGRRGRLPWHNRLSRSEVQASNELRPGGGMVARLRSQGIRRLPSPARRNSARAPTDSDERFTASMGSGSTAS